MPARVEPTFDNGPAVRQIIAPATEAEFLDHLIEGMHGTDPNELVHSLERMAVDRDAEIEDMCTSNHQEFINSVNELDRGRDDCTSLGTDILNLVQSYQTNTDNLAAQKKNLVDSRSVRQNVDESAEALKQCLEVLRLSNQVHELVGKQNHYAALRALDELRSLLRLRENSSFKILDLIEESIPATQRMIAEAVMTDLNTWLFHIRDVSQYIGEVAMFHTEQRRTRQKERGSTDDYLATFKLNSPIELVADETDEFDVLDNDEAEVNVDFTPLFECLHIHEALDQLESFRTEYAITRRRQKELIVPSTLKLADSEASELKELLESIVGFCIIERSTLRKTDTLRNAVDVDELWDSMCQSTVALLSSAINTVDNTEMLLKVTGVFSLFIQTMESWGYHASSLNTFLMTLFEKYAFLLKKRCSEDFQEIVSTDDYMPMPISTIEEYDKIIDVGWYTPEKPREEIVFPCVLPFSQMYPMCCIDIRNFLNQVYSAPDDYLNRSSLIDETIRKSLDELLCDRICQPLRDRLRSQYPGQIVQIMTNFEHFEQACQELQSDLAQARAARARTGPVVLRATVEFRLARQKARERIFELVNSKINDLIETAEYEWNATGHVDEPSNYMTELTRYLSNIMNSVLLGLPTDVKDLIYFDALSNAASGILSLPLDPSVRSISPSALQLLVLDVKHLTSFVAALPAPSSNQLQRRSTTSSGVSTSPKRSDAKHLTKTVEELTQTIGLMASEDPNEFFDISLRNKKYAAVDARNGPVLLEKVEKGSQPGGASATFGDGASVMSSVTGEKTKTGERFRRMMDNFRNVGESGKE